MTSTVHTVRVLAARRRISGRGAFALALLVGIVAGGFGAARHEPTSGPPASLDLALSRLVADGDAAPARVIIQARSGQMAAVRGWLDRHHARVLADHPIIDAVTAVVPGRQIRALAGVPGVASLSSDVRLGAAQQKASKTTTVAARTTEATATTADATSTATATTSTTTTTTTVDPSLVRTILGLDAKTKWTGHHVTVGVVDSGLEETETIGKIKAFYDFTYGRVPTAGSPTTPYDDFGHGNHVASLIANDGDFQDGVFLGVAPDVTLVGFKVLDGTGQGYVSDVIRALDFAVANKALWELRVLNLSLGHVILEPAATDPLVRAVERAVASGLVAVVSAGNHGRNPDTLEVGYGGITSPGNAPSAISVGALDTKDTAARADDVVAAFSSRGPSWYDSHAKPDLVAPGVHLVGAVTTASQLYLTHPNLVVEQIKDGKTGAAYIRLSGTSMSAAVTSGVVALVLEANAATFGSTALTPNAVKAMLQFAALPLAGTDTLTQGAGGLNGIGATTLAQKIDPRAAVGSAWLVNSVTTASTIAGTSYAWGTRVIWGDRIIWGNQLFYNDPAWAQRIVWGDRVIWGDRMVWGDSLVLTDRVIWGDRIIWGNALVGYNDPALGFVWGDRIIWGNVVDASRIIWGNAATVLSPMALANLIQ